MSEYTFRVFLGIIASLVATWSEGGKFERFIISALLMTIYTLLSIYERLHVRRNKG